MTISPPIAASARRSRSLPGSAPPGCCSIPHPTTPCCNAWNPPDLLDFLDTKKRLPGERKPVFPEGVPGLEQGVPKDLYKSNVEQRQQQDAAAAASAASQAVEAPKPQKAGKSKGKSKQLAT